MRRPVGVRRMAQPRIQVAVRITLTGHRVPATTVMGEAGVRELMGITGLTLRVTARRNRVPGMAITVQVTIMVREITALAMIVRGITSQATTARLSPATTITVPGTLSRGMVLTIPERVTGIVPVAITAPGMRDSVRDVLRRRSGIMPIFTTMCRFSGISAARCLLHGGIIAVVAPCSALSSAWLSARLLALR